MSYLDEAAARIRACLPAGTGVPEDSQALFRLYAVLMRAKGTAVTAEDVHDAWSSWIQEQQPDHEALLPFVALSPRTQAADDPFVEAIRAAAAEQYAGRPG